MVTDNPDRRYQIFIASTFSGLENERKAAIEAVIRKGHIPIALERFVPTNQSDVEVIQRALADSQVCIFIIGHLYGGIIPQEEMSFLHYEYKVARESGLLTLTFCLDDESVKTRREEFRRDHPQDLENDNDDRLEKFRALVKRDSSVAIFKPSPDPEVFLLKVLYTLADQLPRCEARGFIKEPKDPTVIESARNEFIVELVSELRGFEKLYDRTLQHSEKKRRAARFFIDTYIDRLKRHHVSLFFESGSTVAFVAKEMVQELKGFVTLDSRGAPNMKISTNNVLAYLLMWLRARIPCTNFPWTPPVEPKFGAAYGGLEELYEHNPNYQQPPLDEIAREEIKRLDNMEYSLRTLTETSDPGVTRPALLLAATSGLQLSGEPILKFPIDSETRERGVEPDGESDGHTQAWEEIRRCVGPHVGSYRNKVFKRFMYGTRLPLMIFLTSDKINSEIEVGKCHFILDTEYRWEDFYKNHPLAFCVSCERKERPRFIQMFKDMGFKIVEEDSARTITCFIARNQPFDLAFENKIASRASELSPAPVSPKGHVAQV